MRSFTFTIVLLVSLCIGSSSASAHSTSAAAAGAHPVAACYYKKTVCCWKYYPCGYYEKTHVHYFKCHKKICKPKCYKVCKPFLKYVYVKKCVKKYLYKKHCVKDKYSPKLCVKKPYLGSVCSTYKVRKVFTKCKKACKKVCDIAKVKCIYYKIFEYPKYCPQHGCYDPKVYGDFNKPPVYFSTKYGKLIKKYHEYVPPTLKKLPGHGKH